MIKIKSEVVNDGGVADAEFYLFASRGGSVSQNAGCVFYRVAGERVAAGLCRLFEKQFGGGLGKSSFGHVAETVFAVEDQVILDEALEWLANYDDADLGVYDPEPSKGLMERAQYAVRARRWEELLRRKVGRSGRDPQVVVKEAEATEDAVMTPALSEKPAKKSESSRLPASGLHGRLRWDNDFKEIRLGGALYNLEKRRKARFGIQYLVESKAFDECSAQHLETKIEPYVRQAAGMAALPESSKDNLRIQHYFTGSKNKFYKLYSELIRSAGNGRFFLHTQ